MDPVAAPDLFPYAPRPHQRELIGFLRRGFDDGSHVVVESGTGTGKTVSALSAALASARDSARRVVFLTRTNSQARQVMVEYRAIRAASPTPSRAPFVGVAIQGRQHMCPLRQRDSDVAAADAEELGVMCRDRMKSAEEEVEGKAPKLKGCPFYRTMLEQGSAPLYAWARDEAPDAETFAQHVAGRGQCPYVLARALAGQAELVVAPYVYLFHPQLRHAFLRWMGAALEDLVIVVDEAHNVPEYARELSTARLGAGTLERALQEARQFGDPTLLGAHSLTRFLSGLDRLIDELRASYLPDDEEDALLPPDEFQAMLLSAFTTSSPALDRALTAMEEYAAAVREAKRRSGKVPRSYVGAVAAFLRAYRQLDPDTHVSLVERENGGDAVRLVAFALDPTPVTEVLHQAHATAHMSGTLAPLEEYRETMGLGERARLASFPSPFPRENRLVLVDRAVTTRHEDVARDPAMWGDVAQRLREIRAATDRNVAVFVPSYDTLHRLAPAIRASGSFIETRGEPQQDLMRRLATFKAARGGTLVSVIGGRLSEGLDFPDEELEIVVIVGIPYPRPTAKVEALVRFYDRRFGRGWAWAVQVPTTRRLLQAAGRLIRTPTDRGVVVLLDRRAATLRAELPDLRLTDDPAGDVRAFFERGR